MATLIQLSPNSQIYRFLEDQFQERYIINEDTDDRVPDVYCIYAIYQNQQMTSRYLDYRSEHGQEELLFHGTARACNVGDPESDGEPCDGSNCRLCSIMAGSYRLQYSRPEGYLGKGLYSARMSSKATLYAENSAPDGSEWDSDYLAVLVNTVSVGRVYITEEPLQGMIQPPLFYQSTYGTGSAFADELAVYHEDAIRPAYLIVCENVAVTSFAADPDDEDRLNERDLYNRLPSFTSETFHSSFVEKSIGRTTAAVENSQGRVTCPCGWCAVSGTEGDGYDEPNEYDECYGSDVVDGQLLSAAFGFTPTY